MVRYPSRSYITPRTRMIRRFYLAAAIAVIVLIAVITLYSLSEKTEPEPSVQQPTETAQKSPTTQLNQSQPAVRMVEPLPQPEPDIEIIEHESVATTPEPEQQPTILSEPNTTVAEMIAEAMALLNERPPKVIEARERLNELLPMEMSPHQRKLIKEQLSNLADLWLFSPSVYPGDNLCEFYTVKIGDRLADIGREYKVPWEIIQQINHIPRPEALQAGQRIKVIKGPFHARVYRSNFTMDLFLQDTYIRSFPVGLGRPGHETPTGLWLVKPGGKLIKPTWTDPDTGKTYTADDPDYPLGSRWIGLEGISGQAKGRTGFAIHGTKDANEIGTAKSRGCIRLYNGDVILIYDLLMPGSSHVEVVD